LDIDSYDFGVAELYALRGHHYGLQSRPADFVDRDRRNRIGQTAAQRRLARGILTETGLNHAAHDHFVNRSGLHAGPLHCFAHDHRAQLGRFETLQRAQKPGRRRAHRANDYCFLDCHRSRFTIR